MSRGMLVDAAIPRGIINPRGVVILSFASKSDDANSSSYGAGITSIGGR